MYWVCPVSYQFNSARLRKERFVGARLTVLLWDSYAIRGNEKNVIFFVIVKSTTTAEDSWAMLLNLLYH